MRYTQTSPKTKEEECINALNSLSRDPAVADDEMSVKRVERSIQGLKKSNPLRARFITALFDATQGRIREASGALLSMISTGEIYTTDDLVNAAVAFSNMGSHHLSVGVLERFDKTIYMEDISIADMYVRSLYWLGHWQKCLDIISTLPAQFIGDANSTFGNRQQLSMYAVTALANTGIEESYVVSLMTDFYEFTTQNSVIYTPLDWALTPDDIFLTVQCDDEQAGLLSEQFFEHRIESGSYRPDCGILMVS